MSFSFSADITTTLELPQAAQSETVCYSTVIHTSKCASIHFIETIIIRILN